MRDDDDKENLGGSVTQDIEGENHQIAGRDIVNHYQDLRPKRLCDCNADELRAEREWSRKIIADARRKIKSSWPYRFAHVSVPAWMLFVFWVWHTKDFLTLLVQMRPQNKIWFSLVLQV